MKSFSPLSQARLVSDRSTQSSNVSTLDSGFFVRGNVFVIMTKWYFGNSWYKQPYFWLFVPPISNRFCHEHISPWHLVKKHVSKLWTAQSMLRDQTANLPSQFAFRFHFAMLPQSWNASQYLWCYTYENCIFFYFLCTVFERVFLNWMLLSVNDSFCWNILNLYLDTCFNTRISLLCMQWKRRHVSLKRFYVAKFKLSYFYFNCFYYWKQ